MWYLTLRRNAKPRDQFTVTLDQHLVWMKQQHEAGRILFSGPTPDRSTGIYVIRAGSREEAERIAASDPYTAGGGGPAWRGLRPSGGAGVPAPPKIKVYLLLLLPHPEQPGVQLSRGAYADVKSGEIWAVCRPESPAEGLEEAIGHLMIFQPYAPAGGEVPFLREGLVAYIMAHAGGNPPDDKLHRAPAALLERGERFLIFPWLVERSAVNQR